MEESIIQNTPEELNPLFCKYLYEDTYFLIVGNQNTIPKDYFKKLFDVNVYIKTVSKDESKHIDVTFIRFLPDLMKQKYRFYKNDSNRGHF